jgi:3-isopropylmalate/(R)-2-methylmalate dehydratase large subunit
MITGQIWLRVPESICVTLVGWRPRGLTAKDVALALVAELGADGASYQTLEFEGPALPQFTLEERLVLANLAVEMGAKAAIFPADDVTEAYLRDRTTNPGLAVEPDAGAAYTREVTLTLGELAPRIAMPHAPDNVLTLDEAIGTPIQMAFIGTCTGGRVSDVHEAIKVLTRWGGRVAMGVQFVVTPASEDVRARLEADGSLARLAAMGAVVTTAGCGACCGTSGVVPSDGMNVISTANRNFKARMGNATASIYLASPAACAAAAATGRITDPR